MQKYKVGDKVRVIDRRYAHNYIIGKVYEIGIANEVHNDYKFNVEGGGWVRDEEIELVTDKTDNHVTTT